MSLGTMRCPIDGTQTHDAQVCPYCLLVAVSMGALSCQVIPKGAHDTQTERFRPPCKCHYCRLQYGNRRSTCGIDLPYIGHVDRKTIAGLAYMDMKPIRVKIVLMRLMVETSCDLLASRWCRNRRVREKILSRVNMRLYSTQSPLLHQMSSISAKSKHVSRKSSYRGGKTMWFHQAVTALLRGEWLAETSVKTVLPQTLSVFR